MWPESELRSDERPPRCCECPCVPRLGELSPRHTLWYPESQEFPHRTLCCLQKTQDDAKRSFPLPRLVFTRQSSWKPRPLPAASGRAAGTETRPAPRKGGWARSGGQGVWPPPGTPSPRGPLSARLPCLGLCPGTPLSSPVQTAAQLLCPAQVNSPDPLGAPSNALPRPGVGLWCHQSQPSRGPHPPMWVQASGAGGRAWAGT